MKEKLCFYLWDFAFNGRGEVHVKEISKEALYRRIAGNASNTALNQWNQIRNRATQVIIPWALPLLLVQIMKTCSLDWASISSTLGASNTIKITSMSTQLNIVRRQKLRKTYKNPYKLPSTKIIVYNINYTYKLNRRDLNMIRGPQFF